MVLTAEEKRKRNTIKVRKYRENVKKDPVRDAQQKQYERERSQRRRNEQKEREQQQKERAILDEEKREKEIESRIEKEVKIRMEKREKEIEARIEKEVQSRMDEEASIMTLCNLNQEKILKFKERYNQLLLQLSKESNNDNDNQINHIIDSCISIFERERKDLLNLRELESTFNQYQKSIDLLEERLKQYRYNSSKLQKNNNSSNNNAIDIENNIHKSYVYIFNNRETFDQWIKDSIKNVSSFNNSL
ncbi:hypothetical protein CYY_003427, partial [Polysphondylium violaceum]